MEGSFSMHMYMCMVEYTDMYAPVHIDGCMYT